MDVWERFKRDATTATNPQSNLVVIGDQSSGKSTIISRFIDQSASTKPTVALEYLYGRKGNSICHIWEAGGEFNATARKMIEIPLQGSASALGQAGDVTRNRADTAGHLSNVVICMVLDLSHLERIDDISTRVTKLIQSERLKRKKDAVKVLIVANKYDKFSSRPNKEKLCVNNFLRSLALSQEAILVQVRLSDSNKDPCNQMNPFRSAQTAQNRKCWKLKR